MAQPGQTVEILIAVPTEFAWRAFRRALCFDVTVGGWFNARTIAVLLRAGPERAVGASLWVLPHVL